MFYVLFFFFPWKKSGSRRITNRQLSVTHTSTNQRLLQTRYKEQQRNPWPEEQVQKSTPNIVILYSEYESLALCTLKSLPALPQEETYFTASNFYCPTVLGAIHLPIFARLLFPLWFPNHSYPFA